MTDQETSSIARSTAVLASRLISTLIIVGGIVWTALSYREWRSLSERLEEHQPVDVVAAVPAAPPSLDDFLNGRWSFRGLPWSVRIRRVPNNVLSRGLSVVEFRRSLHKIAPAAGESSTADRQVFSWVAELCGAGANEGGYRVFRFADPTIQFIAIADAVPHDRILGAQLTMASQDGSPQLIELIRLAEAAGAADVEPTLLSFPPSAKLLAVRRDVDDRTVAEVVEAPSLEDVLSLWRREQPQVAPSSERSFGSVSLKRGAQHLRVWWGTTGGSPPRRLFLVTIDSEPNELPTPSVGDEKSQP